MYQRAFAIVADEGYFCGLWALLNSIEAYYGREYRVFVIGHNLPQFALAQLGRHPLGHAITVVDSRQLAYPPPGAWEAKQCVLSHLCGIAATVCLLDADLVLLSRLDDAFDAAERGLLVTSQDGDGPARFGDAFQSYGGRLPAEGARYFNSGFFCLSLLDHWDIAALWEFTSRFAGYSPSGGPPYGFAGHGDQGVLNAIVALLDKGKRVEPLPQAIWCNSGGWTDEETVDIVGSDGPRLVVENRRARARQRLLHSTGPKWWTPGGRHRFATSGDVLNCFDHFATLHPRPRADADLRQAAPGPGCLRYVGDISRQDAQVLAGYAASSNRILEFGVGASTQVLAQVAPPGARITTVETDPHWIQLTRRNLHELGIRTNVEFVAYRDWLSADVGLCDMVFADGEFELRADFAERAWGFLRVGGVLLVHDTRRPADAAWMLDLLKRHHLEVDTVSMNERASNISVVRKKVAEPYVNWNIVEAN